MDMHEILGDAKKQKKSTSNADSASHNTSFMYTRRKLKKVANDQGGTKRKNKGRMLMGNSDDIIDWNFDHDDLNKPIYNIASENMKNIEFPIFEYD